MNDKTTLPPQNRGPSTPARAEMRPEMRDDDPRARAAKRAAEIREHVGHDDDGMDEFYVDPSAVPDGWSYEWKRDTCLGAEDPSYQITLARKGWEPVPVDRHPSFMPANARGAIRRKGMVLMERPKELTDEAVAREKSKARTQLRQKEEQLQSAPQGQFERNNKGEPMTVVKRSYEPAEIPRG